MMSKKNLGWQGGQGQASASKMENFYRSVQHTTMPGRATYEKNGPSKKICPEGENLVEGSGAVGSFLMLLSEKEGTSSDAIFAKNNSVIRHPLVHSSFATPQSL